MSIETAPQPMALEYAPSATRTEEPTFARILGLASLFPMVLGVVVIAATEIRGQEPWVPLGMAYLALMLGIAGLLYHAVRDGDIEFRRTYGFIGLGLLLAGAIFCIVPGRPSGSEAISRMGYYALPWGAILGLCSMLFLTAALRHETDAKLRGLGTKVLFGAGLALIGGAVVAGILRPETLIGPGIVLGILGLGFFGALLTLESADDGLGRLAAVILGLIGTTAIVYAIAHTVFPTVLFDGP
ncbi:MAG: hypothetical protein ACRCZF_06480, partial [Gemmataceae bacterium]